MELYEVVAHNSKHLDSALEDASKPCSPYGNSSTVEDVELIAKLKDALQKWKEVFSPAPVKLLREDFPSLVQLDEGSRQTPINKSVQNGAIFF
ncbi:hypothetical protein Y1Q_0000753 [Alligator mississippiensis]|uniref:Uncharacterized protein n=1 Tax=Alligator mississippiensis TaxID=8496 RepID=A0A151MC90_ALLMI|nr:hypothetical protein Y1Q_0000753 [Alligator mississippiensis]